MSRTLSPSTNRRHGVRMVAAECGYWVDSGRTMKRWEKCPSKDHASWIPSFSITTKLRQSTVPLVFLCREEREKEARVDEDHGSRR